MSRTTQRPPQAPQPPRLYLATPPVEDGAAMAAELGPLIAGADIAAVLLRLAPGDPRTLLRRIAAIAPVVQNAGAALLLDGHADLVPRAGADGVHVPDGDAAQEALSALRPARMVGVGALTSRHAAMTAGEAGADYVLFGEPDAAGARPGAEAVAERVAWWAEIFEVPCVGYAGTLEEIAGLVRARADFILLDDAVWRDPRGPRAASMDAAERIGQASASFPLDTGAAPME